MSRETDLVSRAVRYERKAVRLLGQAASLRRQARTLRAKGMALQLKARALAVGDSRNAVLAEDVLPVRAWNALVVRRENPPRTAEDVARLGRAYLLQERRIGKVTVDQIEHNLGVFGLRLAE